MKKISTIVLGVAILALTACGSNNAKAEQSSSQSTVASTEVQSSSVESKQTLLFFMNPHGRPCQIQDEELRTLGDSFNNQASVQYVKTTEMETARALFGQYGIRSLPTLILLDENGAVKKRFTPGIHSGETIMSALN